MRRPDGTIVADTFEDAAWHRKPSGFIFLDGKEVANTIQCCHCGGHFVYRKGSGKLRTGCNNCRDEGRYGMLCEKPSCLYDCLHYQKKLDLYEKGKLVVLR